jgi:hypothetical protein
MLKRYLIKGFLIATVFIMLVGIRVFYLQRSHFMAGENFYSESKWKLAIREYDAAMHFYTPWSPYIEKSAQKLWSIGEMFEKENKLDWAIIAYSSIRSSFYSSRSLYTPGKEWITRCNEKIAGINVAILIKEGSIRPEEAEIERQKHLFTMTVDRAPDPFWSAMVEIGFFGWVGSVLFIISRTFNAAGRMHLKPVILGIVSFVFTFSLWVAGLMRA